MTTKPEPNMVYIGEDITSYILITDADALRANYYWNGAFLCRELINCFDWEPTQPVCTVEELITAVNMLREEK